MPPSIPPLLTADLPGVGGRIKQSLEDFQVEEIPAYEPSGQGDHLYLWIEKAGLGPEYFLNQIAKRLQMPASTIGTAGLKDRHAVTRQWVSVPKEAEPRLNQLEGDGIRLLKITRHTNKLRPGHLRGNRFQILIREADAAKAEALETILQRIREQGLPNYYGPQRFGRDGDTATIGLRLIQGERVGRLPPFRLKLHLSAVQSMLFNDYLGKRLSDGLFRTVLDGDVMMKWPVGGLFVTESVAAEQERLNAREIVVGGPMFGTKMFAARHEAARREAEILSAHNLTEQSFAGFGKLLSGTRRHHLIYIDELAIEWVQEGLKLQFVLPSGCYATVLLREIMKSEANADDERDPS